MKDPHESTGYWTTHYAGPDDGFQTRKIIDGPVLSVVHEKGVRKRPMPWTVEVSASHMVAIINLHGTLLASTNISSPPAIILPRTFVLIRGHAHFEALVGRGNHSRLIVSWPSKATNALAMWTLDVFPEANQPLGGWSAVCPKGSELGDAFDRLGHACQELSRSALPTVFASLHLLTAAAIGGGIEFSLAIVPSDTPLPVSHLVAAVREDPAASWSLKDASRFAGYSPFHLSRTFRTIVGYGFPEFVDRCRTEMAIHRLRTGDFTVDEVALACGFGSTQAMRDSFREYIGLLPSELKSAPSEYEAPP